MNYIKDINKFLSEAISLKMYKENLPKELWYDKSDAYYKWDNLFGKGVNRISIPLKNKSIQIPSSTPLMEEINSVFVPLGYQINSFEDYLNNKVYKIGDTKNPMKIGGLLNKTNSDLFKRFDTSLERKEWKDKINNSDKDLKIIISRHQYDLLGMSSGRDWRLSSCMRLGSKDDKVYRDILCGVDDGGRDDSRIKDENSSFFGWVESEGVAKSNFLKREIVEGTLVAYVVKSEDVNINNPLSRLLIKPYVNNNDETDIVWVSADKVYGQYIGGFKSSVDEWLSSWQGDDFGGLYYIKGGLYDDGKFKVNIFPKGIDGNMKLFLDKVVGGTWVINKKGEVTVSGDVYMVNMNLTEIPVKFLYVSGSFNCADNQLTTLKNCPDSVGMNFNCFANKLTSLEFAPTSVGMDFDCSDNKLTSLMGSPKNVGRTFDCSYNQLTSLKFSPKSIEWSFNCSKNQLTSLDFCPKKIRWMFNCSYNQLTSLVGSPKKVQDFNCSRNNLTSLQGSPTKVESHFDCGEQINKHKFTHQDVWGVCKVGGQIWL